MKAVEEPLRIKAIRLKINLRSSSTEDSSDEHYGEKN